MRFTFAGAFILFATAICAEPVTIYCTHPTRADWKSRTGDFALVALSGGSPTSGATLVLVERSRGDREVWRTEQREFPRTVLIADDGSRVVASGCRDNAFSIYDETGRVIRSLDDRDYQTISEGLRRTEWQLASAGTHLVLKGEYVNEAKSVSEITRRVRLSDGATVDLPVDPLEPVLPTFACPADRDLRRFAGPGTNTRRVPNLGVGCFGEGAPVPFRSYEFDSGSFRLIWERVEGRVWSAFADEPNERGPCETIYRNGKRESHRCGLDVLPSEEGAASSTSSRSSSPSPPRPSSSPPSSSPASSP